MDADIVIIGAGVVGLACAATLADIKKNIIIIERHDSFGEETSSRNSEVVHAGIYYPQDSLKAKLCVPGKFRLYEWADKYGVKYKKFGKYIVAINEEEEGELDRLYNNAKANGVDNIRFATKDELDQAEPHVRATAALFSPDTGIIDSHNLMQSFEAVAISNGVIAVYNHEVTNIFESTDGYKLTIRSSDGDLSTISAAVVINSAGLNSDTIAELSGIDIDKADYRLNYCRGHYFRIRSGKNYLANHLIYPVPQKQMHGIGIHVTKELNGELKLGPDTEYLGDRVQDYSVFEGLKDKFYMAASSYLIGLEYDDISPDQSGIRPKLQKKGGGARDFIIKEEIDNNLPGLINLIGIESPGLTCSLEIGNMVKSLVGDRMSEI